MNAINSSFIVLCTLLVLLMTPALAMFYSGMVRSKNTLNTIMNCFIVFGVITLQWVVLGFSLSFGKDEGLGLVGNFENFLLEGISGYNASRRSKYSFCDFSNDVCTYCICYYNRLFGGKNQTGCFGDISTFLEYFSL